MGGNVSRVRERAFHRSGYSNTPFRGRANEDDQDRIAGDHQQQQQNTPGSIAAGPRRSLIKAKRRLVEWRHKKGTEGASGDGATASYEVGAVPLESGSSAVPMVVATSPMGGERCACQGNGCIICEIAENLPPSSSSNRMKRKRLVNINTCNVSDLSALDGVDQLIATNIVIYREKKGRFKQLDKLLKVPGLTKSIYCRIAPYVTVVSLEDDDSSGLHINEAGPDSNNLAGNLVATRSVGGKARGHSRNSSAVSSHKSSSAAANDNLDMLLNIPVNAEGGKDMEQANIDLIYRLMCSKSDRPKPKDEFEASTEQPNQVTITYDFARLRMGCWDLEGCSFDKAHNPGVLEVICMTILENRWNFVMMVDCASDHVLDRLASELNFPTLNKVKMWRQSCQTTPRFDCVSILCPETKFRYGYLFAVPFATLEQSEGNRAAFKIGSKGITFYYGPQDMMHGEPTPLLDEGVVRIAKRGLETSAASGNLLYFGRYFVQWSGSLLSKFSGRAGIVDEGLTHLAIPNGWTLGGRVTQSNPIWLHYSLSDASLSPITTKP